MDRAERLVVPPQVAKDYPVAAKSVLGKFFHDSARSSALILQELGVRRRTVEDLGFLLRAKTDVELELFHQDDPRVIEGLDEINKRIGKFEETIIDTKEEIREPIVRALTVFSRSRAASEAYQSANDPQEVLNSYYEHGSPPSFIKR